MCWRIGAISGGHKRYRVASRQKRLLPQHADGSSSCSTTRYTLLPQDGFGGKQTATLVPMEFGQRQATREVALTHAGKQFTASCSKHSASPSAFWTKSSQCQVSRLVHSWPSDKARTSLSGRCFLFVSDSQWER